MNIETQETADLTQIASLLDGMSIAMLTSVERDGSLVSRPMTPLEMDTDGTLWFFTDARSEKNEQLVPLNLSFSDESHSVYVSIAGHGEVVRDREHIKRLWTPYARPWFLEGPDSPHLVLLKFVPHVAEYWDAPHSKMVRLVAMAASMAAGRPIGLGEHDRLDDLQDGETRPAVRRSGGGQGAGRPPHA